MRRHQPGREDLAHLGMAGLAGEPGGRSPKAA